MISEFVKKGIFFIRTLLNNRQNEPINEFSYD